ncbi:MAG: response regulator, partial [Deltaproteobacteria bacterium]|nr:response regulator [Deltaproteobacteria bacterium]
MNILVVEDDISFAQYITELVEGWNHKVERASSGKDALKRIEQSSFDLVLLDLLLPDIPGYELIPRFKKVFPDIPIVAMTGSNSRELEMKVRENGILYYMIKPFQTEDLKSLLEHLSQKHSERIESETQFQFRK